MSHERERFVFGPSSLADRETGLEWQRGPAPEPLAWTAAQETLAASGWRLPSVGELMSLLTSLPPALGGALEVGDVLWSGSHSPFAPRTTVRAVVCDSPARFGVVLRDRGDAARLWGVRDASARSGS
jgi:hypothetical protein